MKLGYSLFLKEYVKPSVIDYEDCRIFQIVCPICKEPVYKVTREIVIHYFSHYKKDETLNEQCELRVNQISQRSSENLNIESRNQKLSLFLQVFRDIIWKNEYTQNTLQWSRKIYYNISKSSIFMDFKRYIKNHHQNIIGDRNEIFDYIKESIENIFDSDSFKEFKSKYSIYIQKDYSYLFLQHLLAGHAKENYYFLLNHAFILYFDSLNKKVKAGNYLEWENSLLSYLLRFMRTQNEQKRKKIMVQLGEYEMVSPYTNDRIDLFVMLGSQLNYYSFFILLRIPYLDILKNKLDKKDLRSAKDWS